MKFPTEDEIKAVTSELVAASHDPNHSSDGCELCSFMREFDKRGKDSPTAIDEILLSLMQENPMMAVGIALAGVKDICRAIRFGFFVGIKVGIAQESVKSLEDMIRE